MPEPSYEELLPARAASIAPWRELVKSLQPGDVKEIVPGGRSEQSIRHTIKHAAKRQGLGKEIVTRKRDGRLYAVRLKPEDIPDA